MLRGQGWDCRSVQGFFILQEPVHVSAHGSGFPKGSKQGLHNLAGDSLEVASKLEREIKDMRLERKTFS